MLFRKTREDQLWDAVRRANTEYDGNLTLADVCNKGHSSVRARLSVRNSRAYGARLSANGRHGPYASWEAHRDFLRALFVVNPEAKVVTGLAQRCGISAYTVENFEQVFPQTGSVNIGSQINPRSMPELSDLSLASVSNTKLPVRDWPDATEAEVQQMQLKLNEWILRGFTGGYIRIMRSAVKNRKIAPGWKEGRVPQ